MSDTQGEHVGEGGAAVVTQAVLVRQVSARLAHEFGALLAVEDVIRCVARACSDLGLGEHAALPELVERLARVRLIDRIAHPGAPTCVHPGT